MPRRPLGRQISAEQALKALGMLPPTALDLAINPNAGFEQQRVTIAAACRKLSCSRYDFHKALRSAPDAP